MNIRIKVTSKEQNHDKNYIEIDFTPEEIDGIKKRHLSYKDSAKDASQKIVVKGSGDQCREYKPKTSPLRHCFPKRIE